jgi:hypothetical protein
MIYGCIPKISFLTSNLFLLIIVTFMFLSTEELENVIRESLLSCFLSYRPLPS